jgi:hypothetical protein
MGMSARGDAVFRAVSWRVMPQNRTVLVVPILPADAHSFGSAESFGGNLRLMGLSRDAMRWFLWLLVFLLALPTPSLARTWHILVDGSGDAPTIQAGINAASVGDTVLVAPGRYFESINFWGKDLVLKSESGPKVTIIDGSDSLMTTVLMTHAESRAAVLEGFTITGGSGSYWYGTLTGGGLVCSNSSPVIRNNHFIANHLVRSPYGRGGGVAVGTGQQESPTPAPILENNLFQDNVTSGNAGGLMIAHADVTVRGNVFVRNDAGHGDGGGIWATLFLVGEAIIEDNQFWENHASDHGGGVYIGSTGSELRSAFIQRNLFVRNTADGLGNGNTGSGGGLWVYSISGVVARNTLVFNVGIGEATWNGGGMLLVSTPATLTIKDNIVAYNQGGGAACEHDQAAFFGPNLFWENDGGSLPEIRYQCPGAWGDSIIVADPLFCGPDIDNFTVAENSPALTGKEVMGVFPEPGCGPGTIVEKTTWGQIKARYR